MKKIALFLSIVVAAVACEQAEVVTPPEVDFANPDVVIPFQGSEDAPVTINFNANVDWTAQLDNTYDWISIAPASGKAGEAAIEVIASENESEDQRTAVVIVKAGVTVLSFDIVQNGVPAVAVDPVSVSFTTSGGTQDVTVNANVEYVLSVPENDWLTYEFNEETGVYTLTASANELYGPRSLEVSLLNNLVGISETFVVSQEGRSSVLWEKSLSDFSDITFGSSVRLAYKDGMLAVLTNGSVYTIDAMSGAYKSTISIPEGMAVNYMTNDDAGNIVVAATVPYNNTGDVYAISSLTDLTPVKVASLTNNVYGFNAGSLRAGGDVKSNGVVVMFADVSCYWIGCDIVDGVSGETISGGIPDDNSDPNATAWSPDAGCACPLGSKLADGVIGTYYTTSALYHYGDGAWNPVGGLLFSGNDNNCSVAEATYQNKKFAAVGVGSHFNYSATGAYLYDIAAGQMVYSYKVDGELSGLGANADVALVPTDNALYMFFVDLNKSKFACIEIK